MVVIDASLKFAEVEILKSTTTKVVRNHFDRLFATYRIPDQITTDIGPPFDSNEMTNYMARKGIKHHRATPLWPQANREVESFMKPLGKAVKAAKIEGKDWKEELYELLLAYCTTPHTVTGVSSAELLFNRQLQMTILSVVKEREVDYKESTKKR